ncbi:MAG: archaeosortase/exosortase family protein [Candidatus Binatia bacterium]
MRGRLSPGSAFGLRFFAYLFLFSFGFWLFSVHQRLGPVQRLIARLGTALQQAAGGHAVWRGDDIVIRTMILNINHECTGVFVYILFASFVLAYPAPWLGRLTGMLIGTPLIFAVNVFRIATLARVVEIYPHAFFYLHEYVWQGVFTVLVLIGAIGWAERYE